TGIAGPAVPGKHHNLQRECERDKRVQLFWRVVSADVEPAEHLAAEPSLQFFAVVPGSVCYNSVIVAIKTHLLLRLHHRPVTSTPATTVGEIVCRRILNHDTHKETEVQPGGQGRRE